MKGSKADFIWDYFKIKYEMEFLSGFIGIKQDKNSFMLRPEIGWLVKDKVNTQNPEITEKEQLNMVETEPNSDGIMNLLLTFVGMLIWVLIFILVRKSKKHQS
jgi:hypothetical protein